MKRSLHYILLPAILVCGIACKKDNYKAPGSMLNARVVYKGESIGVEYNQVVYNLFQYGFGKVGPIGGSLTQDGVAVNVLFDGVYKFIIPNGEGPFKYKQTPQGDPDSVTIEMKGNQTVDIEVTPYYMIRNAQFNQSGGRVSATFKVEKIITDASAKNIESVTLYLNKTDYVSGTDHLAEAHIDGAAITDPDNLQLTVAVPSITPAQNYIFARIGVKIAGVEDRLFSPVKKIQL